MSQPIAAIFVFLGHRNWLPQWKWGKEDAIITEIPARKFFREVTGLNTSPGVDSFVQQELTKNWAPV